MSLETEMLAWLHEARKTGGAQGAEEAIHRFLQLARREGAERTASCLFDRRTMDESLRERFPIRRTVTEPNVQQGPFSQWRMSPHGHLEHRDNDDDPLGWRKAPDLPNTPRMAAIVAELIERPTITREVEE